MDPRALRDLARQWRTDDPDPATQAELGQLLERGPEADAELADRFSSSLDFGTAGLRGILGAGPNRMNRAVVARATWGLAQELLTSVAQPAQRTVVVGGDARRMSPELAQDTANILASAGMRVFLFDEPVPTPFVAFAVKLLGAAAGVVVTASHNPPQYNGYKVYWGNGAQIVPPVDERIAAHIARAPAAREIMLHTAVARLGELHPVPADVSAKYLAAVHALQVHPGAGDRRLRIVYTPLHGVGDGLARSALSQAGFTDVTSVPEQQKPDGAFPTVAFPNPEERGTMDLAFALARRTNADLVLANDPDADRLAVAVPDRGQSTGWRQLTGNEVGVLLGNYLLTEKPRAGQRAVMASIVSTPVLGRMAKDLGVRYEETLTGFKWIANKAIEVEKEGISFVFGFEEALGYTVGDVVRDKDGISAALLVAEMAAVARERGRTLADELEVVARRWGAFASTQVNVTRTGEAGVVAIRAMMDGLRRQHPGRIDGDEVLSVADFDTRVRTDLRTGEKTGLTLPRSNVLTFDLASGSRIIARPSGTEPKAKFYFDASEPVAPGESVAEALGRARAKLQRLSSSFAALAVPPETASPSK
jgi:phosphomannomutase